MLSSSNKSPKSEALLPALLLICVSEHAIIFVLWEIQDTNLPWYWVGRVKQRLPCGTLCPKGTCALAFWGKEGAVSSVWGFGNLFLNKHWKSQQDHSLVLFKAFFFFYDSSRSLQEAAPINKHSALCSLQGLNNRNYKTWKTMVIKAKRLKCAVLISISHQSLPASSGLHACCGKADRPAESQSSSVLRSGEQTSPL